MMIMAQHPHQKSKHNSVGGAAPQMNNPIRHIKQIRDRPDNIVTRLTQSRKSTTSTTIIAKDSKSDKKESNNNELIQQQFIHGQDGRRTLIKNQLYLIEQLQLENANLRNERDQLQLENEELKFQLQMISSSHILSQSNGSYNERQLDRVNDDGNACAVDQRLTSTLSQNNYNTASNVSLAQRYHETQMKSCLPNNAYQLVDTNHAQGTVLTSQSGLARITATPLRQQAATRLSTCNNQSGFGSQCTANGVSFGGTSQLTVRSSASTALDSRTENAVINNHTQLFHPHSIERSLSSQATGVNCEISSVKPTSLTGFNFESNPVPLVCSNTKNDNHDEQDEQIQQTKIVEQIYGDIEKVQAAAIVIQRAFRKYQICKRFRMITEQLRHTCKSTNLHSIDRQNLVEKSSNDGTSCSVEQKSCGNDKIDSIHYASGSTKAAAWESLSQAASRLAASAMAATVNTKQALANGVTKSTSCQQVGSASRVDSCRIELSKTNTSNSSTGLNTSQRSGLQIRSNQSHDPVVAAAINFQQLESMRKRHYRVGLNIFNKNPEKGVSFLIAYSFIDSSPPYSKNNTSYYLSNQLHFIDKQHITAQQQSIPANNSILDHHHQVISNLKINQQLSNTCRSCFEEENLKRNVAHFLLHRKGLAKEKIGQFLGNLQSQFNQDILKYYLQELDFQGLQVDIALRKFSSTLRMPGEAQKIERFVDYFATRYVQCQQQHPSSEVMSNLESIRLTTNLEASTKSLNICVGTTNDQPAFTSKNNLQLLSKDEIFILTFAIIMLNTDLHSPSLKSSSRMSVDQFINNLRGVFTSRTIHEADLVEIYDRVKTNQITTTPDHVTHVMKVQQGLTTNNFQKKELPNLCVPHRRLVCFCRLFEVYDINKKERVGQHQREIFLFNDTLLVTKLSRRARTSVPQQYTFRQCIPLQNLYVQLFQSAYYNFGIRLCQRSNDETLIMFNARNELDQSRFVDDLNESIAEMDEMEAIRVNNIIDTIHFKQQDRLRKHALLHETEDNMRQQTLLSTNSEISNLMISDNSVRTRITTLPEENLVCDGEIGKENDLSKSSSNVTVIACGSSRRLTSKFNSMSDLASVSEAKDENGASGKQKESRNNRSSVQQSRHLLPERRQHIMDNHKLSDGGVPRSFSTTSVHSLDSGLFLSRDVSPNQSG